MKVLLLALVLLAALVAGCREDDKMAAAPPTPGAKATGNPTATAGRVARLIPPSSTCGDGAPRDIVLACGIKPAPPRARALPLRPGEESRVSALPVRPGEEIRLHFNANVARLLMQYKRVAGANRVEELTQLEPVPGSSGGKDWTIRIRARMPRDTFLGLVAVYEETVRITHLTTGGTVPIDNAVIQYQIPLQSRP